MVGYDRITIGDGIEPAAMAAYAMASDKAVCAKMGLDLPGRQRFHAMATTGRVRQMRRRLLVR